MSHTKSRFAMISGWPLLVAGLLITALVYWPGLSGGWVFDDYPNIVDNHGVQPAGHDLASLLNAALSSPSSDFKRPLASLSFALNFLANGGLNAPAMKATNLVIHLINGLLAFILLRRLIAAARPGEHSAGPIAAFVAVAWMLLPINLTAVLYVVQRMESLANLFVLAGLLGYVAGRCRMLAGQRGMVLTFASVVLCTGLGALAKETAIMLPLYALALEVIVFGWRKHGCNEQASDRRLVAFYIVVLAIPFVIGATWLVPTLLDPATWARRDFTLTTRLLSEARIVIDYIGWTLAPTPHALSFYHDDFVVSQGLFQPWTTAAGIVAVSALIYLCWAFRRTHPLASVGIAWYVGCHLLTGTVLPLELVYEHRNYFASLGLILAVADIVRRLQTSFHFKPFLGWALALIFLAWQGGLTWMTANAWGDPLSLASELAYRAPRSPRAQYELGRTYIMYSHYDPQSPFTPLAYPVLERAAALPGASVLPEQALIFMNSRMHRDIKPEWWASMQHKLQANTPTVQDESSLGSLGDCLREKSCDFAPQDLLNAFIAALGHPAPSPRLLAMYADFAWNTLGDRALAFNVQKQVVRTAPGDNAYRTTLARMATAMGSFPDAHVQITALEHMNTGGRLSRQIDQLRADLTAAEQRSPPGGTP